MTNPPFFKTPCRLLLCVHQEEDDRVEGGVGHGQPEEGEEDVLGERLGEDVGVVVGVEEVGVVGEPAHPEHCQHHHEHDAHLGQVLIKHSRRS